jgi:hypothetical protein
MKFRESSAYFVKISYAEFEEIFNGIFYSGLNEYILIFIQFSKAQVLNFYVKLKTYFFFRYGTVTIFRNL